MKKDIMISYSTMNQSIVKAFLNDFEKSNISCWVDFENLYLKSGDDFTEEIKDNIRSSEAVLLIYTKEAKNSDFVKKEIKFAFEQGKKVFCFPYFPDGEENDYNRHQEFSEELHKSQWLCTSQQLSHIPGLNEYLEGHEKAQTLSSLIKDMPAREDEKFSVDIILARIGIQQALGKPLSPFGTYTMIETNPDMWKDEDMDFKVLQKSMYINPSPTQAARINKFLNQRQDWQSAVEELNAAHEVDNNELYNSMLTFIKNQCNASEEEALAIIEEAKELATDVIEVAFNRNTSMFNGPMVGVYDIYRDTTGGFENRKLIVELYQSDYFTFKFTGELFHLLKKKKVMFDIKTGNIKPYAPFLCSLGLGGFNVVRHEDDDYLMWVRRSEMIQAQNMWHFSYDETVNILRDLKYDENGKLVRDEDGPFYLDSKIMVHSAIDEELRLTSKVSKFANSGIFEIGLIECDRLEVELLSCMTINAESGKNIDEQLRRFTDTAVDHIEIAAIDYIPLIEAEINRNFHGKFITPESKTLADRLLVYQELGVL